MTKDNLAQQMDNVLVVIKEKPQANLPVKTNNWMGIQGGGDWEGLAKEQIHPRQLTFNNAEDGVRAGAISLITRAIRKNNKPELTINQIFFEDDAWAEDKESYKMDTMSKGISANDVIDVMDRNKMIELIKFISNHEMGPNQYGQLKNVDKTINKALDRAYEYVLSDDYSLKEFIK
jgi:putative lipase involved disintegration of autophagic bodies